MECDKKQALPQSAERNQMPRSSGEVYSLIGREDLATEEICQDFLGDLEPTYIGQITTDGFSAAN